MPLLDLTVEAGILEDVIWPLIDGKHIVSVPHLDGLLVGMVEDSLDEVIDGMAADFAMRLKEITLAVLDRTREVKRLSESVPKVMIGKSALNMWHYISKGWCVRDALSPGFIQLYNRT